MSRRPTVTRSNAVAKPASAANFWLGVLALAAGLAVLAAVTGDAAAAAGRYLPYVPILPCLAIVLVLAGGEWLLRRRGLLVATQMLAARQRPVDVQRVALRVLGWAATLGLVALAYWLFPEYAGDFYAPYWQFLRCLAPLLVVVPVYFYWVDLHAQDPRDEYVQFGTWLIGRRRDADPAVLRRHLLGWVVKGFFLPLMTVYLYNDWNTLTNLRHSEWTELLSNFDFWFPLAFTIDLLFCVIGYTAALRLFDSQIRSVEPTVLGWVAALLCYEPFYSVIGRFYLQYEGTTLWHTWLAPWPAWRTVWGVAIIALSMIYAISTVAFGLRFSNLTHRGIITSGPYRYSKHPAYLSKNLSWWLISVPFVVGNDVAVALRHCLLLLLLNGVYFLRARTEERHLSRDPVYVEYARWIDRHGLLSPIARRLPWR